MAFKKWQNIPEIQEEVHKLENYLIDPADVDVPGWLNFRVIKEVASKGVAIMRDELLKEFA